MFLLEERMKGLGERVSILQYTRESENVLDKIDDVLKKGREGE